jgi:hypothetical protein
VQDAQAQPKEASNGRKRRWRRKRQAAAIGGGYWPPGGHGTAEAAGAQTAFVDCQSPFSGCDQGRMRSQFGLPTPD